jgi:hypothetical protein
MAPCYGPGVRAITVLLAGALLAAACRPGPGGDAAPAVLRAADVVAAPERHLGRPLTVDIVEPLRGPSTPEELARTEYGQIAVDVRDAGGELTLVPAAFQLADPRRYTHKFDRVLASPLRVRGELLKDADMSQASGRPSFVFRVAATEPLPKEPAVALASLAVLDGARAAWDRRRVVVEGEWVTGFEVSALERRIWLVAEPGAETVGAPLPAPERGVRRARVRVTGLLLARPGARYGHGGGYDAELVASRIEVL